MQVATMNLKSFPDRVIVVGVDGSEPSIDALEWAVSQARRTDAALKVVTVWNRPTDYGWGPWPADWEPQKDAESVLRIAVSKVLGDDPDIEVVEQVVEGHPAPTLVDSATGADLLVVGCRGHGAFAGMLLGSVSNHCASHAPCPVVIVRHSDCNGSPSKVVLS
jgi:nucleotide-binding universal stress UspA family protein